ncbi:alanine racemase [Jannaschia faecimaris]|uniref:alanine racemase n=1 Tax=Jannaschia faecimaris TaxID=1244108 RepID=A0A1H3TX32_9RHOB|nr:alanine racemase [Jannaschia faecimaris]SDZ54780.1 alanine racemase [Jannaschia faecimaris]
MKPDRCPSAWCEIHRDRISSNLKLALGLVPKGRKFCAVLKADAYGHGIHQVVPLIQAQGVSCVGITSNAEAYAVRDAGFDGVLIRLRAATPLEIDDAVGAGVEEQVGSLQVAEKLHSLKAAGHTVRAHLALNASGMSRDGLEISTPQGRTICFSILKMLVEDIVGICTHFPCNEPEDLRQTAASFQDQVSWVFENSVLDRSQILVHAGSSLTLVSDEAVETDMYRCGAILYGILKPELGFQTTMEVKARVASLGDYPKGATVGYDRDCRLEGDRRLACLSIGYANGFRRGSHTDAAVVIGNRLAPVLGKVSMNTVVVDATELDDVQVGDEATVFGGITGTRASLTTTEQQFRTIMADLYSDWGLRNQRIFR